MSEEDPFAFLDDVKATLAAHNKEADDSVERGQKKKSHAYEKSEGSFNVDKSDDITMDDILDTLQNDPNAGGIRTQVESLKKSGKVVSTPLEDYKRKQIERELNYEQTNKVMSSKWVPQMTHLKHKEQITYGYSSSDVTAKSTALLVEKFEPTTNLEAELLLAAEEAGLTDEGIRKSDAFGSAPLEQHERQRQVARLKSLLFREQQRAKRLAKIKSKTYHRIKNRSEERQKESLLERLEVENPELALQLREEAERKRAVLRSQKRANARSKWAAAAARFGGSEMRKVVSEQAQKAHDEKKQLERMAKVKPGGNYVSGGVDEDGDSEFDDDVVSSGEEEEEDQGMDILARARQAVLDELDSMNKDATAVPKGIMSLPFMQRAEVEKMSAARAAAEEMLKQLEKRELEGGSDDSDLDSDEEDLEDAPSDEPAAPKGLNFSQAELAEAEEEALKALGLSTGQNVSKGSNVIKVAASIDVSKKIEGDKVNASAAADSSKRKKVGGGSSSTGAYGVSTQNTTVVGEDSESEDEGEIVESSGVSKKEESNPWISQIANAKAKEESKQKAAATKATIGAAKTSANAAASDVEVASLRPDAAAEEGVARVKARLEGALDVEGGDIEEALLKGFNRQEGDDALIRQAFVGGEGFESAWKETLAEEEEAEIEKANEGKGSLPGWGAGWAGGVKTDRQIQKEKSIADKRKREAEERRTKSRPLIILSEKLDRKAAKYQVKDTPMAFGTKEAYEATLNKPLGPEWNTSQAHKRFIQPQINVRVGAVVAPLQHAKHLPSQQADSLLQAWDSRKRKNYTKSRM